MLAFSWAHSTYAQAPIATGSVHDPEVGPEGPPPDVDKLKVDISRELVIEYNPAAPTGAGGGEF